MTAIAHNILSTQKARGRDVKAEPLPAKYSDDIDLQLMARVKAGDEQAFNTLMKRNEKAVVNLVYRFTGNREVAGDLAQDVFLRIYRASGRFEARAKFFTYLYTVTRNVCRNYVAKAQRHQTTSLNSGRTGQDGSELPDRELVDPIGSAEEQVSRLELSSSSETPWSLSPRSSEKQSFSNASRASLTTKSAKPSISLSLQSNPDFTEPSSTLERFSLPILSGVRRWLRVA